MKRRPAAPGKRKPVRRPARARRVASAGPEPLIIVGIGASAGGLEAVTHLLEAVSPGTGMAFVVVQHLAPRHESALPVLLAASTKMPVSQVTDGVQVEADHVYVIPPDRQMELIDGKLKLGPRPEGREQHTPIDRFFRSLARHAGEHAVGIILSGTASDGALGLREIKAAGGITIAQDPSTAAYGGMPNAAVATGVVDLVLPVQAIAAQLHRIAAHAFIQPAKTAAARAAASKAAEAGELQADDEQMQRIFSLLRASKGVDFSLYKVPTIRRRIQRRMGLRRIDDIDEYIRVLKSTLPELEALYHDLLIQVTHFFREPEALEEVQRTVLPALMRDRPPDSPIRIWVPGCATGEEAYSVAILLLETMEPGGGAEIPIQVFGTDVSEAAVEYARNGVYPESITEHVSPERLKRFFVHGEGSWRISKTVREHCVFARQDLTRDPPFSRLDLIVCRNVLIYLGAALQKKLMTIFHYGLKPTGFLVLGKAETVGPGSELFALVHRKHRIYSRRHKTLPQGALAGHGGMGYREHEYAARRASSPERAPTGTLGLANQVLLDRYAPPGVVVDSNLQIVQFRGQTGHYLEAASGSASLNLLKMARDGLLHGLRTALQTARKKGQPVTKENLSVRSNGGHVSVGVDVLPLGPAGPERHYLILFRAATPAAAGSAPAARPEKARGPGSRPDGRLARLEQELAASREYMQSIIQDLEAANEELQSANEEVLSSNEELQSTNEELDTAKEELQSINEELTTLNEELHGRNEELSRVNSDLMNLLNNVQLAIVMVSSDMRIRRFTPTAEGLLNLIPGDIGRPFGNIQPNLDGVDLPALISRVIDTVTPEQREIRDRQGRWYSLTVRPYKNLENKIDGAVLVLYDIDPARRNQIRAEHHRELSRGLLDLMKQPTLLLDSGLRVSGANAAFRLSYPTPGEPIGLHVNELPVEPLRGERTMGSLKRLLERDDQTMQTLRRNPDEVIQALRLPGEDGQGALMILFDRRGGGDAEAG